MPMSTAECPECGRLVALRLNGTFMMHYKGLYPMSDYGICPMSRQPVNRPAHIELQVRRIERCSNCGSEAPHHVEYVKKYHLCVT